MKVYHLSNVESLRVEPIKLGYIFPMPITLFGETAPMGVRQRPGLSCSRVMLHAHEIFLIHVNQNYLQSRLHTQMISKML